MAFLGVFSYLGPEFLVLLFEFQACLSGLSFTVNLLKTCFLKADVDRDGTLNYGEFVAVSVHIRKMANDEHLHKAFAFFDRNQSGYIEIDELRDALSDEGDTNTEDVIAAIMHDVDIDKVSFAACINELCIICF